MEVSHQHQLQCQRLFRFAFFSIIVGVVNYQCRLNPVASKLHVWVSISHVRQIWNGHVVCKLTLPLADTRLIVPENSDSEGPQQPQIRLGRGFEMNLECKRKASITQDKKVLTASQHTPAFSHVAPFCQVASCLYLQTIQVKLENLLS